MPLERSKKTRRDCNNIGQIDVNFLLKNTGDVFSHCWKTKRTHVSVIPRMQDNRGGGGGGMQTDMTTEGRLHLCHKFIVLHSVVHSQKTYD